MDKKLRESTSSKQQEKFPKKRSLNPTKATSKFFYRSKSMTLKEPCSFEKPGSAIMLGYRDYYKTIDNEMKKHKLSKSVADKVPNQRSNRRILGSIHIHNKCIPEGITDVDKNYFKIIQVRSKQKTRKLNRKQYLNDINNCLRQNIITGYFYDEMYKIDEQFETEKNKMIKIRENFSKLQGYFEMFLDDDHKESMNLIAASIRETTETEKKRDILRKKQERLGKIRNEIYGFEEIYEKTLSCAAFLSSITPESFYEDNDTRGYSFTSKRSAGSSRQTLDDIEKQMEEVKRLKPKLYFKDPMDILQLFRDIEVQNLKFMLHTLEFKAKIQEQTGLINLLRKFSEVELHNIRWKVQKIEASIKNIEEQTQNLEERCKRLLEHEYKEFVSGNESILLHAYIAETYSYLMGTEPSESPVKNLAALGSEYKKLKFQADNVPSALLNSILTSVYNSTKERKIKAKAAIRKLTDFDILINRTLKLLDKPVVVRRRKLMTRSPVTSKPKRKPPPPPPVSEEELLQLYLFTDMCRPQHPVALQAELDEDQLH